MQRDNIGVYVSADAVFPGLRSDFDTLRSLLSSLSLTDTLFWCARLNLIVSDASDVDHKDRQQFGVAQFMTEEQIGRVNGFVREHGGVERQAVFFRGQLLELLRWATLFCDDQPGDGLTFEKMEARQSFVKAALIMSDVWAERVLRDRLSVDGGMEVARERALGAARKGVEGTITAAGLPKVLGRGWAIFSDYFPRVYRTFERDFLDATGLSSTEYYICLCAIITSLMDPTNCSGIFDITRFAKETQYEPILRRHIDLESQTARDLRNALWGRAPEEIRGFDHAGPYDYRPLRNKPILRASDGRAIILDPIFYSEKATVGPVFHLLPRDHSDRKANTVFAAFGAAFENYCCDILRCMFPAGNGPLSSRLECNVVLRKAGRRQEQTEADACLNDVTEVVLLEMKAVWLPEADILSDDYHLLLARLRERYGVTLRSTGDYRAKGVGQLARAVSFMAAGDLCDDCDQFARAGLVYPVLVVHDPLLDAPLYGHFLMSEFEAALSPDAKHPSGELQKGRLRVAPLTVMTVSDLEDLETSSEHFALRYLLSDYSKRCPDRLASLHDFMARSDYRVYHSRTLASYAQNLLEQTVRAVFPQDAESVLRDEGAASAS